MALNRVSFTKSNNKIIGECRAISDCTYVQSDLAIHSPQKKKKKDSGSKKSGNGLKDTVQKRIRHVFDTFY